MDFYWRCTLAVGLLLLFICGSAPSESTHADSATSIRSASEMCSVYPLGNYIYETTKLKGEVERYSDDGKLIFLRDRATEKVRAIRTKDGSLAFSPGFVRILETKGDLAAFFDRRNGIRVVKGSHDNDGYEEHDFGFKPYLDNGAVPEHPEFSKKGKYFSVVAVSPGGSGLKYELLVRNNSTGKLEVPFSGWGFYEQILSYEILEDEGVALILLNDGKLVRSVLGTGRSTQERIFDTIVDGDIDESGEIVAGVGDTGPLVVFDRKEKKREKYASEFQPSQISGNSVVISPDKKHIALTAGDKEFLINRNSGVTHRLPDMEKVSTESLSHRFSRDGKFLVTQNGVFVAKYSITQIDGPKPVPVDISGFRAVQGVEVEGRGSVLQTLNRTSEPQAIEKLETACVSSAPSPVESSDAEISREKAKEQVLSELQKNGLCGSAKKIPGLEFLDSADPRNMTTNLDAYRFLYAMQRPGSFQPQKHLSFVLSLLRGNFVATDPKLVSGMMSTILMKSSVLYEKLLKDFPLLERIGKENKNDPKPAEYCLSDEQLKQHQKNAEAYLQNRLLLRLDFDKYASLPSTKSDYKTLIPLTPFLSSLPEESRLKHVDWLGDTVKATIESGPHAVTMEGNDRREFARDSIRPILGFSIQERTRAYVDSSGSRLLIAGTEQISNISTSSTWEDYSNQGFYSAVAVLNGGNVQDVAWKNGAHPYTAKVKPHLTRKKLNSDEVSKFLNDPKSCKFVSAKSHWHEDGVLARRLEEEPARKKYVTVVNGPKDVLAACEAMKKEIGEKACANLEFSGHAGGDIAVGNLYGIRSTRAYSNGTNWMDTYPSDKNLFEETTACLKSLLKEESKTVIFTSCYSSGQDGMKKLAEYFSAPIIGSNGLCSSDGWGAFCEPGFTMYDPKADKDQLPVVIEKIATPSQ